MEHLILANSQKVNTVPKETATAPTAMLVAERARENDRWPHHIHAKTECIFTLYMQCPIDSRFYLPLKSSQSPRLLFDWSHCWPLKLELFIFHSILLNFETETNAIYMRSTLEYSSWLLCVTHLIHEWGRFPWWTSPDVLVSSMEMTGHRWLTDREQCRLQSKLQRWPFQSPNTLGGHWRPSSVKYYELSWAFRTGESWPILNRQCWCSYYIHIS